MAIATAKQKTDGELKAAKPSAQRRRRRSHHSHWIFYAFISPWLIGFVGLTVVPLVYALLVSFTNFDGISPRWRWIGLANYTELLHDPDMWFSLGRTFLFMGIMVPLSIAGGLGLAVLLNQRLRAVGLFRTIFYLPSVVPVVAAAVMWRLVFDRDAGALNALLERLGGPTITWLIDPTVFLALIVMVLWGLGGGMLISLAGLQGIPNELHEAALVDGANKWQQFRRVTLPLLSPVLFFQMVTGIINALQTFIQPILLSEASLQNAGASVPRGNDLYLVNVYQQFFFNQRFGYGSAMLWVFFAFILVLTLLVMRSSNFWVYYEIERD